MSVNNESRTVSFETSEGTGLSFDISPDGETIVFDLLGQLWMMPAKGGEAIQLTDGAQEITDDRDPNFSPDGRWIAFQRHRNGESTLWLMPTEGGDHRQLADTETGWFPNQTWLVRPSWSPDGQRLAYTAGSELRIHYLDGNTTTTVHAADPGGQVGDPFWLPGGRALAFREGWRLSDGYWWQLSGPWLDGNSLSQIDPETGSHEPFLPADVAGISPSFSPDGTRLALFRIAEDEVVQLWVVNPDTGEGTLLLESEDLAPLRVRWTPAGQEVVFVEGGKFRRMTVDGDRVTDIPFRAHVEFEVSVSPQPQVRFAEAGSRRTARGNTGLALSADGQQVGLIALGRLWIWPVDGDLRQVAEVPPSAKGLSWAPDGSEVVLSAGPEGRRSLYATNVRSGETRRLTSLPATAYRPQWSPDGRHIAFLHAWGDQRDLKLAVIDAYSPTLSDTSQVQYLTDLRRPFIMLEQHGRAVWNPSGDALLVYGEGPARLVELDGSVRPLAGLSPAASFVHWLDESSMVYTRWSQLWHAPVVADSVLQPSPLSERTATHPRSASGHVLYLSDDGYYLFHHDTGERHLSWPDLEYHVDAPPPVLLRGVRVLSPDGTLPDAYRDILIEEGRISRIADAGSLSLPSGARLVEGEGRTVIPGLIDLHYHVDDPLTMAGNLYWGVTALRDMGTSLRRAAAFSESIESGAWPGPRVLFGGYTFIAGAGGPQAGMSGPRMQIGDDFDAHRRAISLLTAHGGTYAKMLVAGTLSAGADFIHEARSTGLLVGGHGPRFMSFAATGVNDHQHYFWGDTYQDWAGVYREADIAVVPTFTVMTTRSHLLADTTYLQQPDVYAFVTPHYRTRLEAIIDRCGGPWQACREAPHGRKGVERLHASGVRIGAGSDYSVVPTPGVLHWELEELVLAGLLPAEALAAATSDAAKILGAQEEIGTIEEGKWADLLLLDANPLEDIRNTRKIWKVIQGGNIVDRDALLEWASEQQPVEKDR